MTKVNLKNWNETKTNTFFHGTYFNQISYDFFFNQKSIKAFQWLSKSEFLNFKTSVNPNHGNETKLDISMNYSQIWHHFTLVAKYWNISVSFMVAILKFYWKSEHKEVRGIKIERGMSTSDSIFP